MSLFENVEYADHERVTFVQDHESRLRAVHAIHRLSHGRSGGGIRFYPYANSADALNDALRLSRAMTYKMVLTGLPIGGAKTVIIGDPAKDKTEALLFALGRYIESLDGIYLAGPDVGTGPADMAVIRQVTSHVTGLPGEDGGTAAPTARGVYLGIKAAVKFKMGRDDLAGLTVAVQGVGGVGSQLCAYLHQDGASLIVADVNQTAVARVASDTGAQIVEPDEILSTQADVLAPCALGAVINDQSIPHIKAIIICGGANNQLAEPRHGRELQQRGILFAPDYAVNGGGALAGVTQAGLLEPEQFAVKMDQIYHTVWRVFEIAEAQSMTPDLAAQLLAEELLEKRRSDGN